MSQMREQLGVPQLSGRGVREFVNGREVHIDLAVDLDGDRDAVVRIVRSAHPGHIRARFRHVPRSFTAVNIPSPPA